MAKIFRGTLIITLCVLFSRILGVFREILLAQTIGATSQKTAYDLAFLIPDILNHLVSTGYLSITFIPLFLGIKKDTSEEEAWQFFGRTFCILGSILFFLTLLTWIFAEPLIRLLAPDQVSPQLLKDSVSLTRILLPAQLFFFGGALLTAVQHIRSMFFLPALSGIVYNLGIIGGGLLGKDSGAWGFAWGALVGAGLGNFLLQWIGAGRSGLKWRPGFQFSRPPFGRYILLSAPLILGLGAIFSLEYTYRTFGLLGSEKTVAQLGYAYRLMFMAVGVLGYSVGVASYPTLSTWAKEEKSNQMFNLVMQSTRKLFAFSIPIALTLYSVGFPLTRLLFERGAFTLQDSLMVSSYLRLYVLGLLSLSAQIMVLRGFYALERMWLPSLINTGIFLISLPLYPIGIKMTGPQFIPILGVTVTFFQWIVLTMVWVKVMQIPFPQKIISDFTKILVILVMGLGVSHLFLPQLQALSRETGPWEWVLMISLGFVFHFSTQSLFQFLLGIRDNLDILKKIIFQISFRFKG